MPEASRIAPLALLAALLVGCGGQGADAPAPTTTPSAQPSVDVPDFAFSRSSSEPARLLIQDIGIDEELIDLGIDESNGELEVPEDPDRVGWFTGGGKPGEEYPVVMAGHVDSRTGPAVFARLLELQPGQEFTVETEDGERHTYRIDEVRDVPQNADFPTEDVYGRTETSQIRLITCTGDYDRSVGRYTENRVVFASLV
ncbi:class F sortase [Aeromicrobium halocynthiae]|uniref:Class F sortase n=1 Tax=Aeromicrobium halocynthiae TaxID=560557 RepID=A0ABP5HH04_9ACTN